MLQTISGIECSDYNFILFGNAVSEHYNFESNGSPVLRRPIMNGQCFNLLEDDRFAATLNHFPPCRTSPVTATDRKLVLVASQPNIYDPFFVLEWICQLLNISGFRVVFGWGRGFDAFVGGDKELGLEYGIDMKTLFSKQIMSFLVACQTCELRHMRVVSRLHLRYFLAVLEATEGVIEGFPMKYQVRHSACTFS